MQFRPRYNAESIQDYEESLSKHVRDRLTVLRLWSRNRDLTEEELRDFVANYNSHPTIRHEDAWYRNTYYAILETMGLTE